MTQKTKVPRRPLSVPDPRSILLAFVSVAIWVSSTRSLLGTLAWLVLVSALVLLAARREESALGLLRVLRWSLPFSILIFGLYVLLAAGEDAPIWTWGPFAARQTAIETGGVLSLRFLTFVVLARSLSSMLTPTCFAVGVTRMLWPLKAIGVGIESVYYLVFFIARLAPALVEEARIIQFGQRSRGLLVANSWYRRVTGSVALIVPVFAAAMRRSERLSLVLASRGFNPSRAPAIVTTRRFGGIDWLISAVVLVIWIAWYVIHFL
jgi:energy-coupling factor transporter transmembrane protein EcfT